MVTVGEEKGGDARIIALIHSARILLVVMTLPFIVQWIGGVPLGGTRVAGPSFSQTPLLAELTLLACGVVGIVVGHLAGCRQSFCSGRCWSARPCMSWD
jgi:uncharacterized membrane protein AbrB (regulator of aidB expression)